MAKVIVLGGGVAGMSAAHELAERGFEVEVYERHKKYCGGKARSVDVHGTENLLSGKCLPGEHGFRFFPGFYKHVTDTMARIPYMHSDGNTGTVLENLVSTDRVRMARYSKQSITTIVNFPHNLADLKVALEALHSNTGLTEEEKHFFAERVWQLMTSCYDRRNNDYERLSWWNYTQADRFSENYRSLFVAGLTRTLVAANAKFASTKTGGDIFLQLIFNMANPGVHTDRVLNGPTNERWLTPWKEYLQQKGVHYVYDTDAERIELKEGKIESVVVTNRTTGESKTISADYYVLAVPVERAWPILNDPELMKADPTLKSLGKLAASVAWMNGIQFYLNREADIVHGHCIYTDSQWAITSISQLQFWTDYNIGERGNGKVKTILSVDVSDWDTPGFNGKAAKHCNHQEIKEEIWLQLKTSLNVNGAEVLSDDMLDCWHIDGDIKALPENREKNEEPLLVNTVNSWALRPEAYTAIPNLFLASDYVRTFTDLATMEGANEAARRAVNGILQASGSNAPLCQIWNLHEPDILAPFRRHDKERFDKGLPWASFEPWWLRLILCVLGFFKRLFGKK